MSSLLQDDPALLLQPSALIWVVLAFTTIYVIYQVIIYPRYLSPIAFLPTPPPASLVLGHLPELLVEDPAIAHGNWQAKYGPTFRYSTLLGRQRIYIIDPEALKHTLLTKSYSYIKPRPINAQLTRITGLGLLTADGDVHRRQRRVASLAFSQASVNGYLPIFAQQANKLCDCLRQVLKSKGDRPDGSIVNVHEWLNKITLDVIGLAGFHYECGALDGRETKLASALADVLDPTDLSAWVFAILTLIHYVPVLTRLPIKTLKRAKIALAILRSEAQAVLRDKQAQADLDERKDLLALLIKSNNKEENKKDKLSDDEVTAQVTTFLAAGHETSSTTLTWTLLELSKHLDIQEKLRHEVRELEARLARDGRSEPNVEDVSEMHYLEAVVRESLRVHPAVSATLRVALEDDTLPLKNPVMGQDGRTRSSIPIRVGQELVIGIAQWNTDTSIFGEDAGIFNPDRWLGKTGQDLIQDISARNISTFSPLMTFIGGPRGCPGARFAILEVKVILMKLISAFSFQPRREDDDFMTLSNITSRPVLRSERHLGVQLPLLVQSVKK